ncbi:MAG: ferrochelatase [Candidatus Sumerlaeia bacterium]|nr:ferrochelatase [Candidatus Sumerlaeia bacterium]
MSTQPQKRVHVFCLTYGEPEENKWYPQFEYSWLILNRLTRRVAPIPKFITPLLAARRGLIRCKNFNELGWNSPLEKISAEQVKVLTKHFQSMRPDWKFTVELVCEFRPPLLDVYLEKLRKNPPDEILVLPLYVAESDFTTGISRTDFEAFHRKARGRHGLPSPRYIKGYGFDERFADAYVNFIVRYCESQGWTKEKCLEAALVLGAHGTVVTIPPGYNSGAQETQYLFRLIRQRLKERFGWIRIAWLNHQLGGMWTCPSCEVTAEEVHKKGFRKVVYFPFGFIGDNGESMLEGRDQLGDDWEELLYLPCPNDDQEILGVMAQMGVETLENPEALEDWETIGKGDEIFERPELPQQVGSPGLLRFSRKTLALTAATFWGLIGGLLLMRGATLLGEFSITTTALVIAVSLLIALGKGMAVFRKLAVKNLTRLRRMPQPSPLIQMFSKPSWIVIFIMATLGMSLRFIPMDEAVRSTILLGVGGAMWVGSLTYLLQLNLLKRSERRPRVGKRPSENSQSRDAESGVMAPV